MLHCKKPRVSRRWPLALTLLTATHCASSTQNAARSETPTATPVASATAAPASLPTPETPDGLLLQVHIASLGPLAERIATLIGLPGRSGAVLDEMLEDIAGHDRALAGVIDREASVHLGVFSQQGGEPQFVLSFGAGHIADIEQRLGQSHRVGERNAAGVHAVTPTNTERRRRSGCVLVETNSSSQSRLVCADRREHLERLAAWMARGISSQTPAMTIQADLAVEALRNQYGSMATMLLSQGAAGASDSLLRELPEPMRTTATRDALGRLVEVFADAARSVVTDLAAASFTINLEAESARLRGEVAMRGSQADLVRGLLTATQNNTVSTELVGTMPGGAGGYTGVSVDMEPLRPVLQRIVDVLVAVAQGEGRTAMRPADVEALRSALTHFVESLGRSQMAAASGGDPNGNLWSVTTIRYADGQGAPTAIARVRELVEAVRRPGVARGVTAVLRTLGSGQSESRRRLLDLDLRQFRPTTIAGLPAGSYAYVAPQLETRNSSTPEAGAAGAARRPRAPARPRMVTVALIPQGNDLRVVSGPDAATVLAHAVINPAGAHPVEAAFPAPGVEAWQRAAGWASLLFVPAGFVNSLRATNVELANDLQRVLEGLPNHGRAPIPISSTSTVEGDVTRVAGTIVLDRDVLSAWMLIANSRSSSTPPSPPPAPSASATP